MVNMPKADKVKLNIKERVEDTVCDLSLSELNEVPVREIASFKRVNTLDLSSNRLIALGKNFITLNRLVKLDLSKNQIKYLPEDFGLLVNLRHLDLYYNCIEHIPLSFGQLKKLRYLDLKGNPLTPAWQKVIGHCLTTKDCQDAARQTVNTCVRLKKELMEREKIAAAKQPDANQNEELVSNVAQNVNAKKSKKPNKKKKQKAANTANNNELTIKEISNNQQQKTTKNRKELKRKNSNCQPKRASVKNGTALTSIITFLCLLAINIVIIYMIMFKNPEIAEKFVEYIPEQYRNWILTKTEIFRLHITDWISGFRTPPDEH